MTHAMDGKCLTIFHKLYLTACRHFGPDNGWAAQRRRQATAEIEKREPPQRQPSKLYGHGNWVNGNKIPRCVSPSFNAQKLVAIGRRLLDHARRPSYRRYAGVAGSESHSQMVPEVR